MGAVSEPEAAPSASRVDIEQMVVQTLESMASFAGPLEARMLLGEADIDSLDLVELTQVVEDRCGFNLAPDELKGAKSVGDIIERVLVHAR